MLATTFTPIEALIGGGLIGLSAVLLMFFLGRIMGISGIVGGLFSPDGKKDYAWRIPFILGVIGAPATYLLLSAKHPEISAPPDVLIMTLAGLLVGFGASTGSGCTSGHGVCGLSRLSGRSLVSVLTFMAAAFITVFIVRHVL